MAPKLKNVLLALNVLLTLITLLSYLSPRIHPVDSALIASLGLLLPVLILGNVLFLVCWIFIDKRFLFLSLLTLFFGYYPIARMFSLTSGSTENSELVLASYNCNFLKSIWVEEEDKIAQAECLNYLKSFEDVDIFCLQEYGERSKGFFEQALNLPYQFQYEDKTLAIYSRYPIVGSGIVEIRSNAAHSCLWIDIMIDENKLRIYNVHLQSNRHDGVSVNTIVENAPEKVDPGVMAGLLRHYQKFASKRVKQVNIIMEHASHINYPYLICGDMNDTPQSHMYQRFTDRSRDAFLESGSGLEFTYSGGIPFLRLDYVFLSEHILATDYNSSSNPYSDHKLLKVGLRFQ